MVAAARAVPAGAVIGQPKAGDGPVGILRTLHLVRCAAVRGAPAPTRAGGRASCLLPVSAAVPYISHSLGRWAKRALAAFWDRVSAALGPSLPASASFSGPLVVMTATSPSGSTTWL